MTRRVGGNLNIGTSSLLLIFIVLSLVSFAVLSLSSALTDKRLTESNLTRTSMYYEACNKAEYKIRELDEQYRKEYANTGNIPDDIPQMTFKINDAQELYVQLLAHEPDDSGSMVEVVKWKVENVTVPQIDDSITLFVQ